MPAVTVNTSLICQYEVCIGSVWKSPSLWQVPGAMVSESVRAVEGAEATRSTVEMAVSRTAASTSWTHTKGEP
jgi:hypothetical protein